ncbi:MAG: sugar O-acetyltransferase, partial [Bacteroidales bacterium]|nr:sugar O-acetyltransferase [Bacteroidales bacterium]
MTEKEKRDSGVLYNAGSDPELISEVMRAKKLCHEYNSIDPTDFDAQEVVLKKLLGKTGMRFHVYPPFWCDYGYNIELGEDFFANHGTVMLDGGKITFGNNVLVGPGCGF